MSRPTNAESRAAEIRANRRMKAGSLEQAGYKLTVDESKLDRQNYVYRFANDKNGRVGQLHRRDWDIAPEGAKEDTNSMGTVSSAHAGIEEGRPFNTVLLRKHRVLFEDDQKVKEEALFEVDKAMMGGRTGLPGQELKGPGVYTPGSDQDNPSGVNRIEVLNKR